MYRGHDFWERRNLDGRKVYQYTLPWNDGTVARPTGECNFESLEAAKRVLDEELEEAGGDFAKMFPPG